mgnify:CR=1 FL=1|jgi:O-antigen/teichoic acid export membrane protein
MLHTSENNRRIAKNTLLLYFRMLFMLAINLYTARIVLKVLGVIDYGINNVVAGVIGLLGFITGALAGSSSRFITFDLGKGNLNVMKRTFGNILCIHLLAAICILFAGETIGLWFVSTQLKIPAEREFAAFWVYQFSILTSVLAVISVPYNATIIAHEKMSAFAYITILDAILKLLVVYMLIVIPFDKLIMYATLYFVIQAFDQIIYMYYCRKNFEEARTKIRFDRTQFKEILSYSGWTLNGYLACIGFTQGINILLNIFFGPIVNAARGIAVQVQGVCQQFCSNFQMALNPQLTKSYAQNDLEYMHKLLIKSSKFSFYILYLITLPLMFEANQILEWWLGEIPDHTVNFLRLTLWIGLLYTLSNPIIVSVHATGKIKYFQMVEGTMLLTIVPIAYLLLKYIRIAPEFIFLVHILVEICTQYVRLRIVLPMIQMPIHYYIQKVMYPIFLILFLSPIIPMVVYLQMENGVIRFFTVCIISVLSSGITMYFIGCTKTERIFFTDKINSILKKTK